MTVHFNNHACMTSPPSPLVEIPSRDVMALLALPDVAAVGRLVRNGTLTPTRKLPGLRGPFLFDRAQVIAIAEERRAKAEETAASIQEALAAEASA